MDKDTIIRKYLGKKYGYHASSACFLFVQDIFWQERGIKIKHDYLEMLRPFIPIADQGKPEPWDVVCFAKRGLVTDHVGVYLGDNEFIHGGHLDHKEVMVHRVNLDPYRSILQGYLRYDQTKDIGLKF